MGSQQDEIQASRNDLLRLGRNRFGEPITEVVERIESTTDLDLLHDWFDLALERTGWNEIFLEDAPTPDD